MVLWQQHLLLQPCGYRNGAWPRYYSPAWTPGQSHSKSPTEQSQSFTFAFSFSVNSLLVQARPWAGFWCFYPEFHVHKLEQVSLAAGSVLPCPEFLFQWDLRCNGNTATAGNRSQASHECHKAKGFLWLWLSSWLA